ncbi:MAG TPA: zinc-ribbon domain-containing protein [Myxococcaceae bacterium]|nr:zinc-ribbon domain-containing protein [Myxococcaceae bacterium]
MIIPCKQCHTRFKVPDGKVRARGLKVRCSRCGHTFRIYPDSAADRGADPAPAAARPKGPDPFQAFGPEGTSEMEKTPARGTTVSALLAKMEPAATEEDFDVDVSGVEPASTEPAWNFPPAPSRPGAAATAAAAWELEPPGAPSAAAFAAEVFGRAPVPVRPLPPEPEAPPPAPEAAPETTWAPPPAGRIAESGLANLFEEPTTDLMPALPEESAPAGPPPLAGDLTSLSGFTPAWGMSAPSRALSVDGTLSRHSPSLSPPVEPQLPPPPPQFGGAGTVLDDLPSLEPPPQLPVHGELELDAGSGTPDWSEVSPAHLGGNQIELGGDLPSMELDRTTAPELARPEPAWSAPLSPPAPFASPGAGWALAPPAAPSPAPASVAVSPPAAAPVSSGPGWDDPFAELPASPRPPPPPAPEPRGSPNAVVLDVAPARSVSEPDHGFFEMPEDGPSPAPSPEPSVALLPDIPEAVEPAVGLLLPTTSGPFSAISKPPGRMRLGLQERELPGAARRISAVILNVGLAALLLLVVVGVVSSWATAGRVDGAALSPRRVLQALRSGSGVSPVEVTPGTYETRSGNWLLYVRGRVQNRGAPRARVRVRAEVWDGAQAVKTGETLAGAIASPEELWRAATPADVEALRARLLRAATPVADRQEADFLVLLDEAPRDLSGLRLKITASVDH